MKRLFLSNIALAACLVGCVAGNGNNRDNRATTPGKAVTGKKTVRSVSQFHSIEVDGNFNVHFTQGNTYQVSFGKGGQANFSVREGELKIKSKWGAKREKTDVYITAPQITGIELEGAVNFNAKRIDGAKLDIDTKGVVKVNIGKISVTSFEFDNEGTCNFTGGIDAMKAEFDNEGTSKLNITVDAQNLEISNSGTQSVNLKFKGMNAILKNRGTSKVDASLDCNSISGTNFGTAKIVLSGKANHVNIHPDRSTALDTTKLNK